MDPQPETKPPQGVILHCPRCGKPADVTKTIHGLRYDCWTCRTRSWDGKPMVTRGTLQARANAHRAFDPLWQLQNPDTASEADAQVLLGKARAYRMLADELGLEPADVYMGMATEEVALQVPQAVERIRAKLAKRSHAEIMRDYRERGREIAEARRRGKPWEIDG